MKKVLWIFLVAFLPVSCFGGGRVRCEQATVSSGPRGEASPCPRGR